MYAANRGAFSLFVVASALFLPVCASAQVVISEIMYDLEGSDANREWIEIYNSGSSVVNITEWRLFEGDSNHVLTAVGSETLAAGGYAVIADDPEKFREDWPSFSGRLFDSSFSLSNTGETLILRCCGSDLVDKDTVTYTGENGAAGDGKTLQRQSISGQALSPFSPTPGTGSLAVSGTNPTTLVVSPTPSPAPSLGDSTSASGGGSESAPLSVITLDAGNDRSSIVGVPSTFKARAYNQKKEPLTNLLFRWNFGDGSTAMGATAVHAFEYPGRYAVVLSVIEDEAASDQFVVTVDEAQLTLSVLEGGVAIENGSRREVDISGWRIEYQGHHFTMPPKTIILANEALRLTPRTLGFTIGEEVELVYPNGVLASSVAPPVPFPSTPIVGVEMSDPVAIGPPPTSSVPTSAVEPDIVAEVEVALEDESYESIEATSTEVAAAAASGNSYPWWLGALGLAFAGSTVVYVARRFKKKEWTLIDESSE